MKNTLFPLLVFALVLGACSSKPIGSQEIMEPTLESGVYPAEELLVYPAVESLPIGTQNSNNPNASAYPYPVEGPQSAAPIQSLVATPGPIPTPSAENGVLYGNFLQNGQPVVNAILYLAEVKKADNGQEILAAVNIIESPRAYTDNAGLFVFNGLKPGKYTLVLDAVIAEYLLRDPQNPEDDLIITVNAGEATNLRELDFTDLPDLN